MIVCAPSGSVAVVIVAVLVLALAPLPGVRGTGMPIGVGIPPIGV